MKKLLAILLATVMLLSLAACGDKEPAETTAPESTPAATKPQGETKPQNETKPATDPETEPTTEPAPVGEEMKTSRWNLTYNPEKWVYEEDDLQDGDYTSSITMTIPDPEDPEEDLVWLRIYASVGELSSFRYDLSANGFDAYEYAVNNAYKTVNIGGLDFLYAGDEDEITYFTRHVASGVNIEIEVEGDLSNEDAVALVESLEFTLEDKGNIDPPWPWEGEAYAVDPGEMVIGSFTLKSKQIPFAKPIVTAETFRHNIAVSGKTVYLSRGGEVKEYTYNGKTLKFSKNVDLGNTYEYVDATADGTFWFSNLVRDLVNWDGEKIVASYEKGNVTTMHASGEWGIEWGYSGAKKITFADGAIVAEEMAMPELKNITRLCVDTDGSILVSGTDASDGKHRVFVYDYDGKLKATLAKEDGGGLGSVTFAAETENGYLLLDGNMRWLLIYGKDGTYIGQCTFNELFGTDYPWPCDACELEDGSIMVLMTDERPDESADELVAFKLSGF